MAKYILGVPAMVGHSDVITNYKTETDLEGLFVSITGDNTIGLATSSSAVIGVSQAKSLGSASVGQGKQVPVILDDDAGDSIFGKPVYMTGDGKATDKTKKSDTEPYTQTPFIFSATQPSDGEVIKQNGEVVKGALIDTI